MIIITSNLVKQLESHPGTLTAGTVTLSPESQLRVPGCQKLQMMARPGLAQDAL